jgi:hypothetical protein
MNQDIDTIYKGASPTQISKQKKLAIAHEKRVKESVTAKPFNINALKNVKNIKNDPSP